MDFKEKLNEEQYAAVTAPDGPSLVIAAAGTGKTRVLIYRLAWLIRTGRAPGREILLLTFTNKAAKEMINRAQGLSENEAPSVYCGTFHSFTNRLLRAHANLLGFGCDYTILDAEDAKKLMRACCEDICVDSRKFPKPDVLLHFFGVSSGRMEDWRKAVEKHFGDSHVDIEKMLEAGARYQQRKRDTNSMDFDDLLLHAHQLLLEHKDIRRFYQEKFRHVLVDEYQDTNALQAAIVQLLVQLHGNLMVVGDDFQSIYSWRGADFRNFLDFEKTFPGVHTFKLQTNYRSSPEILSVANQVIAASPDQFQKELKAVLPSGVRPRLVRPLDGAAQARCIIEKARMLHQGGIPFSEICVLYRSHFHAMELQLELARERMPYVVTSGVRFFEQAHIKDICTVLRILSNPSDELAFRRLVEMLPRVGTKTSGRILRKFGGRVNLRHPETYGEVMTALPAAAREAWEKMRASFISCQEKASSWNDPCEIIFRFNEAFYCDYLVETFENYTSRSEDIKGLIDFTARFDSTETFLSEIALWSNLDAKSSNAPSSKTMENFLTLSTAHQAKGLEWKAVFVLFLNEELFPNKKAVEESGGSAEERRLFYVAITRAKERLFLCSPMLRHQRGGDMNFLKPSSLLSGISEDTLVKEAAGKEGGIRMEVPRRTRSFLL